MSRGPVADIFFDTAAVAERMRIGRESPLRGTDRVHTVRGDEVWFIDTRQDEKRVTATSARIFHRYRDSGRVVITVWQ